MTPERPSRIPEILRKQESALLADWLREQQEVATRRRDLLSDRELEAQSREFLGLIRAAADQGSLDVDVTRSAQWSPVRDMLSGISRSRSLQGFSPSETASFVFSLKAPLFARLREELGKDAPTLFDEVRRAGDMLDRLGLYTTEVHQKAREEVISRQQQDMLELSTPVVKLWDQILALPMIGTLDSARTQVVMETLLQRIVETGAEVAIIDITGVPTVDTLTAQHLIKTVTAARLMGADCIISGIRPQIAQTIVHLGVDLGDVGTKATLADAFATALKRRGLTVARAGAPRP
ncbi:MAG TPA: STAS domain-containing protein [Gemmatimonadales bacterium]|nr:STAS domain-containing protein [Gemmatimonadales bacterium]